MISNKLPCTRILLSYFSDGEIASDELSEEIVVVSRDHLAGLILEDGHFSSAELKEIVYAASYILKGQCNDK